MHAKTKSPQNHGNGVAFTLVELLVIVALLTLCAFCLLPALARTKPDTRAFQCLNNCRQLSRASRMYVDDNSEKLAVNYSQYTSPPYPAWAAGWLDWGTRSDNTNTILLTNPRYSALALYNGEDARPFKCPSDRFLSSVQRARGWKERVRSVSKNYALGGSDLSYGYVVKKWMELVNPKPSEVWLSMDEHPDSLNDGDLLPPTTQWVDLPANYHDGGAGISFADGRAEIHRWESSVLKARINLNVPSIPVPSAGDQDVLWVRNHTPQQPGAN